jgi:hypothetical protein
MIGGGRVRSVACLSGLGEAGKKWGSGEGMAEEG